MKIDIRNWEKFEDNFPEKEKIIKKKKKNPVDNSTKKDNYKKKDIDEDVLF